MRIRDIVFSLVTISFTFQAWATGSSSCQLEAKALIAKYDNVIGFAQNNLSPGNFLVVTVNVAGHDYQQQNIYNLSLDTDAAVDPGAVYQDVIIGDWSVIYSEAHCKTDELPAISSKRYWNEGTFCGYKAYPGAADERGVAYIPTRQISCRNVEAAKKIAEKLQQSNFTVSTY